ncbi:MAG TPA: hypothetical protein DC038_08835 [Clostridiales bacterium]|nr:hypothetical protein [Clostridiales bacterium]
MEMNENIVITAEGYDKIDGRNAYKSDIKKLTLGQPMLEENQNAQIAAQIWREEGGKLVMDMELPVHRILDLMIFLSRTLLYFREAYRLPLLYDPEKPSVERVGLQGGVMPVSVCTDNPDINENIQMFLQSINDSGEIIGERLRVISGILEELEYL